MLSYGDAPSKKQKGQRFEKTLTLSNSTVVEAETASKLRYSAHIGSVLRSASIMTRYVSLTSEKARQAHQPEQSDPSVIVIVAGILCLRNRSWTTSTGTAGAIGIPGLLLCLAQGQPEHNGCKHS